MRIEWEIEELAYRAMGKTKEQTDEAINNCDIDDVIYDKYEINFETYCEIVKDLLPFTPKVQSALSNESFNAFVDPNEPRCIVRSKAINKDGE